jgi:hypothetical protein
MGALITWKVVKVIGVDILPTGQCKSRVIKTWAFRSNLAHCLFFQIKIYSNTAMYKVELLQQRPVANKA